MSIKHTKGIVRGSGKYMVKKEKTQSWHLMNVGQTVHIHHHPPELNK